MDLLGGYTMPISAAFSSFAVGVGVVPFAFTSTASPILLLQNNNSNNKTRSSSSRRRIVAHHPVGCSFYSAATAVRCSASGFSDVEGISGSSLFPLHRCKTLHLLRHAQGIHNVEGEKDHKAYLSPELFDAHLSPVGWSQLCQLRASFYGVG